MSLNAPEMMNLNPYQILGIPETSKEKEVAEAYILKASRLLYGDDVRDILTRIQKDQIEKERMELFQAADIILGTGKIDTILAQSVNEPPLEGTQGIDTPEEIYQKQLSGLICGEDVIALLSPAQRKKFEDKLSLVKSNFQKFTAQYLTM